MEVDRDKLKKVYFPTKVIGVEKKIRIDYNINNNKLQQRFKASDIELCLNLLLL